MKTTLRDFAISAAVGIAGGVAGIVATVLWILPAAGY